MIEADEHLSFNQLIDMADNRLTDADHAEVATHLANCATCAAEFVLAERLIAALTIGVIEHPSQQAVAHVQALFRTRQPAQRPLVGTLLFDSRIAQPVIGFRSTAAAERQLLFLAEDTTIDLRVASSANQWAISGQILGPVLRGIVTLADTSVIAQVALSELAEFILPPVETGIYTLTVVLDEREITIPELIIGGA